MLPAHFSKMHALLLMMLMGFVAMTTAQPQCDPLTEHELNGLCCKMCGPGTRMSSSSGTCQDPHCPACGDNEYQEEYTKETKCQRQPYCDPNTNFQVGVNKSKNKKSPCMCKDGFHCSSGECVTCVPHTKCEPGHGAVRLGTHTVDTVCQKCPEGTFSTDSSWDSVCRKWTVCESGYDKRGTDKSDNICEAPSRGHIVLIVVLAFLIVFLVASLIGWCLYKGNQEDARGKVKVCVGSCFRDGRQPLRETKVVITTPTDATDEESMKLSELQSSQEEGGAGPPEENEDQPSQEISAGLILTENGKVVTEEYGKSSVLSRQESQPHTFPDSCGY